MTSSKERECIQKSLEAKASSAKYRLDNLRTNGIPFDSPIGGFIGGFKWNEKTSEKIKQIVFMPLAIVLFLFMVTLTPFLYISHLWEVKKKKQELKQEINRINSTVPKDDVPQDKTLESLWRLHGLDKYKYASSERLSLLGDWVGILYGEIVVNDLNLERRVREIENRHDEANRSYYEGKEGAPHFYFISPVDSLIKKLSEEPPRYE